ncbi:MAG: peptide-methionine (S)-S-oxide reductase, partial [Candidatus Limnocylindrales bacterium]
YQERLTAAGFGPISTTIAPLAAFYFAENDHQQYLAKNPLGYCPDHATGVSCPVGVGVRGQP